MNIFYFCLCLGGVHGGREVNIGRLGGEQNQTHDIRLPNNQKYNFKNFTTSKPMKPKSVRKEPEKSLLFVFTF